MGAFDRLYEKYDRWYEEPFGKSAFLLELRCIKKLYPDFGRAIEIGVGTGRFAGELGIRYGVDPSLNMLRLAVRRGVLSVVGEGENLPFKDGVFDTALLVVSICFVKEPAKVVREAGRVLKDKGKILIGAVLSDSPWADFYLEKAREGHPIYKEARFYSFEEINTFLNMGGFEIRRVMSTLLEEPQDRKPIKNQRIEEGFKREAGFTCILAEKI